MVRFLIVAAFTVGFFLIAAPASAQYRFDPTVDPSTCRWWQICDYGGRAYRGRIWRASCPIIEVTHNLPDGRVVIERRRDCRAIRVRG